MRELSIGILALQGAVSEHETAVRRGMASLNKKALSGGSRQPQHEVRVFPVRQPAELKKVDGIIMPGGESTTISKLLTKFGLREMLVKRVREGMPIMGTCAGMVLMASEGDDEVGKTGTELLRLMDMEINRNAFGRQRESFEIMLGISVLKSPFPGVFIRAPGAVRTWGGCHALCSVGEYIVMAEQENCMALAFHPELTGDTRIHELFLQKIMAFRTHEI